LLLIIGILGVPSSLIFATDMSSIVSLFIHIHLQGVYISMTQKNKKDKRFDYLLSSLNSSCSARTASTVSSPWTKHDMVVWESAVCRAFMFLSTNAFIILAIIPGLPRILFPIAEILLHPS